MGFSRRVPDSDDVCVVNCTTTLASAGERSRTCLPFKAGRARLFVIAGNRLCHQMLLSRLAALLLRLKCGLMWLDHTSLRASYHCSNGRQRLHPAFVQFRFRPGNPVNVGVAWGDSRFQSAWEMSTGRFMRFPPTTNIGQFQGLERRLLAGVFTAQ